MLGNGVADAGLAIPWKWEPMDRWRNKFQTQTAIMSACQVDFRDPKAQIFLGNPKAQIFLGKEWRIECTNHTLAEKIHSVCNCVPGYQHSTCEGSMARNSAFYTPSFARKVIHHMKRLDDHVTLGKELCGDHECWEDKPLKDEKAGRSCECRKIHVWNQGLSCFGCMLNQQGEFFVGNHQLGDDDVKGEKQESKTPMSVLKHVYKPHSKEEKDKALRDISLIHASTGHGSYHLLVQALKRRRVHPEVLQLAEGFRCSSCEERKRPDPRKQATLHVSTDRWRSVQMDAAHWTHPTTKPQCQFVVMLDEASRFMLDETRRERH